MDFTGWVMFSFRLLSIFGSLIVPFRVFLNIHLFLKILSRMYLSIQCLCSVYFYRWKSWHSHFSATNTLPLPPPGVSQLLVMFFVRMMGSSLIWSGILEVSADFISSKPNLLIRIESVARGWGAQWVSWISVAFTPHPSLAPALHWLCQSVNDDRMCLSTCSSHHEHVIIAWTLFLAYCLFSLPSVSLHLS